MVESKLRADMDAAALVACHTTNGFRVLMEMVSASFGGNGKQSEQISFFDVHPYREDPVTPEEKEAERRNEAMKKLALSQGLNVEWLDREN